MVEFYDPRGKRVPPAGPRAGAATTSGCPVAPRQGPDTTDGSVDFGLAVELLAAREPPAAAGCDAGTTPAPVGEDEEWTPAPQIDLEAGERWWRGTATALD